ncbi:MAG: phospho-sugar mutase [Oscillospiraceae bacterium]|nr:phospho-sugar mutase [Oscillospiraceae bacterium]
MNNYNDIYNLWIENADKKSDVYAELKAIESSENEIKDRFYQNLTFGTAGLRGVIGAGTNRMNGYTVAKATQGLADYLNSGFENPSAVIGYDSRVKSAEFANAAAEVLAANGVKVFIFSELMPTPLVSFAVRELKASTGIVITASHNPSKYNGYKCYDSNGYQMTDRAAAVTLEFIEKTDIFSGVKRMPFDESVSQGKIIFIDDMLIEDFYKKTLSVGADNEILRGTDLKVIYTPLNGTGNRHVRNVLEMAGIKNIRVVASQEKPDGNFPTCPYPNPEIPQVYEEAFKMAGAFPADLIIATDPDSDRIGLAALHDGKYTLINGNETSCLLTNYLLSRKKELGTLPESPIVIKTIVTTELLAEITGDYGGEIFDLLTGFKYIGEKITELENAGELGRFQLGMEESYGYLPGAHVRDKDAVAAALLATETAAYYKSKNKTLIESLNDIYEKYGYYLNALQNFAFEGADGMKKMNAIMDGLRNAPPKAFGNLNVDKIADYGQSFSLDIKTREKTGLTLPKSNVLSFYLDGGCKITVRPSGTEPKIKVYISSKAENREKAEALLEYLSGEVKNAIK